MKTQMKIKKLKKILSISLIVLLTSCNKQLSEQQVADKFKQTMEEFVSEYTNHVKLNPLPTIGDQPITKEIVKSVNLIVIKDSFENSEICKRYHDSIKELVKVNGPYSQEMTEMFTVTLNFLDAYGKSYQIRAQELEKGNEEHATKKFNEYQRIALTNLKKMGQHVVKYDPTQKKKWDKVIETFGLLL